MQAKDNVFATVAGTNPDVSRFDLSHDRKMSFNMGELVPVCIMEALPGDKFDLKFINLIRFAPMIAPVMHKVRVKTEYFFVPNRIIWDGWRDFMEGIVTVAPPTIRLVEEYLPGTLADYMGIPPGDYTTKPITISLLPFAAYYKIYDDWYRGQQIVDEKSPVVNAGNANSAWGPLVFGNLLRRAWEHDYFTSALPTSQQGQEVDLPLVFQDDVPVHWRASQNNAGAIMVNPITGAPLGAGNIQQTSGPVPFAQSVKVDTTPAALDPNGTLAVDVQASAATINDLRAAFALQSFLENSIRGGYRYVEQIWSHFKVRSSDARLQRPELICAHTQNVTISEVLATAQSNSEGFAIGTMGGHGISVGSDDGASFFCEEHGYIIGLMSVIPDTAYQDGIHRHFFRFDRLDYAYPEFAGLGEQEVRLKELCAPGLSVDPDTVFGYLPRYSEYRSHPSSVAGDFRDTLSFWTLGRRFNGAAPPTLSEEFITCTPRDDIFAVIADTTHKVLAQTMNLHSVVRKLPRYGVPSMLR